MWTKAVSVSNMYHSLSFSQYKQDVYASVKALDKPSTDGQIALSEFPE